MKHHSYLNSRYSPPDYLSEGNRFYELGKYQDAINSYENGIKSGTKDPAIYYNKGLALFNLGRFQDAVNSYDQAIRNYFRDSSVYNNKGLALFNLGRFQDAVNSYDQAIKNYFRDPNVHNNKGLALFNLGKFQDALNAYEQGIKAGCKDYSIYNNKGLALYKLGKYQDAINAYDQAIRYGYKSSDVYSNKEAASKALFQAEAAENKSAALLEAQNSVLKNAKGAFSYNDLLYGGAGREKTGIKEYKVDAQQSSVATSSTFDRDKVLQNNFISKEQVSQERLVSPKPQAAIRQPENRVQDNLSSGSNKSLRNDDDFNEILGKDNSAVSIARKADNAASSHISQDPNHVSVGQKQASTVNKAHEAPITSTSAVSNFHDKNSHEHAAAQQQPPNQNIGSASQYSGNHKRDAYAGVDSGKVGKGAYATKILEKEEHSSNLVSSDLASLEKQKLKFIIDSGISENKYNKIIAGGNFKYKPCKIMFSKTSKHKKEIKALSVKIAEQYENEGSLLKAAEHYKLSSHMYYKARECYDSLLSSNKYNVKVLLLRGNLEASEHRFDLASKDYYLAKDILKSKANIDRETLSDLYLKIGLTKLCNNVNKFSLETAKNKVSKALKYNEHNQEALVVYKAIDSCLSGHACDLFKAHDLDSYL